MDIYDKFIKDTRKEKMPYVQPGKNIDPIDTSNITDDEPYTPDMIARHLDQDGNIVKRRPKK